MAYNPAIIVTSLVSDATTNSTTTGVKITSLDTAILVGTWMFEYFVRYQNGATTTGIQFGVNFTGTTTAFNVMTRHTSSATNNVGTVVHGSSGGVVRLLGSMAARAESTTTPNLSGISAIDAANSDMLAVIEGLIIVSTTGNMELWHASSAATASTVKAGTSLRLTKTS